MCGIAGFINFPEKHNLTQNLLKDIQNRGPDGHGIFQTNEITFIHTHLAITDQSKQARQPMSEDKLTIIFNGEIYNTKSLCTKFLQKQTLKTTSDTEIILKIFAKIGSKLFHQLEGIFALAIWNQNTGELFLARDHLGIKPLYYFATNNRIAFSSRAKSLAKHLNLEKTNQAQTLNLQNYGCTIGPDTIFEKIKNLPAGHFLKFAQTTGLKLTQFYDLASLALPKQTTPLNLENILTKVIEEQIPKKVKFGVLLSSGVDSNFIAAILHKLGHDFYTFSIGFETKRHAIFCEAKKARELAKHWGSEHHEWIVKQEEFSQLHQEFLNAQDQPSTDGFNSFLAAKLASKFCPVVFSGVGADELFFQDLGVLPEI